MRRACAAGAPRVRRECGPRFKSRRIRGPPRSHCGSRGDFHRTSVPGRVICVTDLCTLFGYSRDRFWGRFWRFGEGRQLESRALTVPEKKTEIPPNGPSADPRSSTRPHDQGTGNGQPETPSGRLLGGALTPVGNQNGSGASLSHGSSGGVPRTEPAEVPGEGSIPTRSEVASSLPSSDSPLCIVDHEVIYRFIDTYKAQHRIATMARILGVSRSGYYAWKTRPLSCRAQADEVLKKEIRSVHACHHGRYGAPRIHGELQRQGWKVSSKRVARLMRELGIDGLSGGSRRG